MSDIEIVRYAIERMPPRSGYSYAREALRRIESEMIRLRAQIMSAQYALTAKPRRRGGCC